MFYCLSRLETHRNQKVTKIRNNYIIIIIVIVVTVIVSLSLYCYVTIIRCPNRKLFKVRLVSTSLLLQGWAFLLYIRVNLKQFPF